MTEPLLLPPPLRAFGDATRLTAGLVHIIQFSIKATGELGNFAVGKLSGDSNFSVKLTWSKTSP